MVTYFFPSPFGQKRADATQWQVTMVKYWEADSQLHNHTTMLFICQCVMNKRENFSSGQTGKTEMTLVFFSFFFMKSSAGAAIPGASVGSLAWWQEAKEGWSRTKETRSISLLLIPWPRSPERVSQGVPAQCAKAGWLWSRVGEAGRLIL